ncbi:MAG: penicillin acylase family protein [Conexivisphaerales archaeon]
MTLKGERSILSVSAFVLIVILLAGALPLGPLPPLSSFLNPSNGIWSPNLNSISLIPQNFTLKQNGRVASLTVLIDPNGFIRIASNETWAVYYEQGYLSAKYRLEQMDLMRRTAEGNLSQILGPSELGSDEFYRSLEMYQVAGQIVDNLSKTSLAYIAVSEYTKGVNAYISSLTPESMPLLFKLLQYTPQPWRMEDTYTIQQLLTWMLSGSENPLYFNYALQKMPENILQSFYPAYPASVQHPIVPESLNPSIYSGKGNLQNLSLYSPSASIDDPPVPSIQGFQMEGSNEAKSNAMLASISWFLMELSPEEFTLPSFVDLGSNNWAVSSNLTGNGALLANDPHLGITVPPIWLGFQLVAPNLNVVGVSFPGAPGVILGHNPFIAWGATDAMIQVTYFYKELLNPSNPDQYMHDGAWTNFEILNESIPVKGEKAVSFQVKRAINGVIIPGWNGTIALDWTGLYPSDELGAILSLDYSTTVLQASSVLSHFKVGIQNWAVADRQGNVGIFSYGLYPIISKGNPRGVLPGTGSYDWVGFIPLSQQPSLYDPKNGFVFSANQIQVSRGYPYYIGWDYESGYRADQIYSMLSSMNNFTVSTMEQIQLSVHDYSTNIFLPVLLNALSHSNFYSTPEYRALLSWNGDMNINSTAATIYYFWLGAYLNDTFLPWLDYYGITPSEGLYHYSFFLGPDSIYHGPLIEDLANWTQNYPNISWFNDPLNGEHRNATTVMILAFNETIHKLQSNLGQFSSSWDWGAVHKRLATSFFGLQTLSTKPLPAGGDSNTPNAAYGLISAEGPSWRQITDTSHPLLSLGIYPGGINENSLSRYYANTVGDWNSGMYYTLIPADIPSVFYYQYVEGVLP